MLRVASKIPLHSPQPPQVSLHNRYEALYVEGQPKDEEDEGPVTPEVSPQLERSTPVLELLPRGKKDGL